MAHSELEAARKAAFKVAEEKGYSPDSIDFRTFMNTRGRDYIALFKMSDGSNLYVEFSMIYDPDFDFSLCKSIW